MRIANLAGRLVHLLVRSQRWTDIMRHPRVAVVIDAGPGYGELRGVELRGALRGAAAVVGEVPRTAERDEDVVGPEPLFARKYNDGGAFPVDGRHAWLRVTPDKLASWNFRKLRGPASRR